MSVATLRQKPPPMAAPLIAPSTGWCILRRARTTSSSNAIERRAIDERVSPAMLGTMPESSRSAPEQKPSPAPVTTTIDGTIVATALPSIDRDLGGLSRLSWVITAYFLAQVAALPLMGKLGDLYGRRRLFFVALTLFTTGSMLCGLAQSIDQLIVFRAVQGLGGGGLGTLAMAIVADIVPARKLPRWLGYQGAIFAVSSIVGPLAGGLFVDQLSWRWAFYVNVPIAAVSLVVVAMTLHLPYRRLPHAIDYA